MIWSIDGLEWDVPCQIDRVAEIRSSEISGVLLDKSYFNDVVGTYMQYTVSVAVPLRLAQLFEDLYEMVTEPVESHVFVLPYGQTTIQIVGRVSNVSDTYMYMDGKRNYWNGFKFTVISNYPTKEEELGDVLEHGMSPMPSTLGVEDGATFTWNEAEGIWEAAQNYRDVDEVYY